MDDHYEVYSERQARQAGELPDTLSYDIPEKLRRQVILIWHSVTGPPADPTRLGYGITDPEGWHAGEFYKAIHQVLCREYGEFSLSGNQHPHADLCKFFVEDATDAQAVDVIEVSFRALADPRAYGGGRAERAIGELNRRFAQTAVGYAFESDTVIRRDSELLHEEVVRPTLHLLSDPRFAGPEKEYLEAHEHYRHGRHEECLVSGLKSFESTIKVICDEKGWSYEQHRANASDLVKVLVTEIPLPTWMEAQLISVATVRNRLGGHGAGGTPRTVEPHFCSYHLQLTGTCIKFVVDAAGL